MLAVGKMLKNEVGLVLAALLQVIVAAMCVMVWGAARRVSGLALETVDPDYLWC
jgi:hypothetical protein